MSIEFTRPRTLEELAQRIDHLGPQDSYNSLGIGLFSGPSRNVELIQRLSQEILLFGDCFVPNSQKMVLKNFNSLSGRTQEKIDLLPLIRTFRGCLKIKIATCCPPYHQPNHSQVNPGFAA